MSFKVNALAATSWEKAPGRPLGIEQLEYRKLLAGGQCTSVYIFHIRDTMDLAAFQKRLLERDLAK